MRIIITGASSFIGRACTEKLNKEGHEVIALRHSFDEEPDRLPEKADCWIHFAWAGKGSAGRMDEDIQRFNVEMSFLALKKAEELSCGKFVFAGSQAEYGEKRSRYGEAKAGFAEKAKEYLSGVQSFMQFIHLRIFSIYGPGDRKGTLIDEMLEFAKSPRRSDGADGISLGNCTQMWNYMYIDDLTSCISLLVNKELQGKTLTLDVAGEETLPLHDFVLQAAEILGIKDRIRFGERRDNAEGAKDLLPDISVLRSLGFKWKYTFTDGIKEISGKN